MMDYHSDMIAEDVVGEMIRRVTGMAMLYGVQKTVTNWEFPEQQEAMPFTLFPSLMPAEVFTRTRRVHIMFQTLIYRVANDHEFMKKCLKDVLPVDDFTQEFWNIYNTVREEGPAQEITLTLSRDDFMMEPKADGSKGQDVKQVEFNTFASGAGGVIGAMRDVHRYSLNVAGFPLKEDQLPENCPSKGLAKGLVKAWQLYGNDRAVVLFVVGIPEPNSPDQRWLERHMFESEPRARVIYRTFDQLIQASKLGENKELLVDDYEVAVVYYRYGYSPKHYPTRKEYDLRLKMERSRAIKCPSMASHLAGCKKIQQVLAEPRVLERFISDPVTVAEIRSVFVGLYRLNQDGSSSAVIEKALANPDQFVMKPQREGGGNNHFGAELKSFLEKIKNTQELSSWILMDRIRVVEHRNRLIRVGLGPECRDVCSELGIFGVHLSTPGEELENFECGWLLRTKPVEANEGGLFSGFSCLDSPFFVDV
ncbi:glutathione synthetase-like isoform X1 [Mya arenaria]|uniref:glutathione synthetase-like isoform X1 n=1 Tax=Mya arenaria TaxID=6604 RepID=UPI0022DFA60A|nr:glutathione synthetase-like isoform X1 [Mya arenaria]